MKLQLGSHRGVTLIELLVSMIILAVGLTATAAALLRIQQSVQIAFHQSQGVHILNELVMQVSTVNSSNNPGVGLSNTPNVPLVDNFLNLTGAASTANPRIDANSSGLTCTNLNPADQNCLFKFFSTQAGVSQNIINGNTPLVNCTSTSQVDTNCYDPDRTDADPTRYRISWSISNKTNAGGIGGSVISYNACGGTNLLAKQVVLTVQWLERGQTYTQSQNLFLGC